MARTGGEEGLRELLFKLFRFAIVGGSATLLYGVFVLIIHALADPPALAGHTLAYALAVPVSYLGQRSFTFRYRGPEGRAVRRFLITVTVAFVISTAAVWLCDAVLGLPYYVGMLVTMAVVPLVSFAAMLLWVFLEPEGGAGG